MTLQEIMNAISEKKKEGQNLVQAKKFKEAEAVKAELDDLEMQLQAEVMFTQDDKSRNLQAQASLLLQADNINNGKDGTQVNFFTNGTADGKEQKLYESTEYEMAWAKEMKGASLSKEELEVLDRANDEFRMETHTTENTGILIPKKVAVGIWDRIEEDFPLWADINKTRVRGALTYTKGTEVSDTTDWYDEETETEESKVKFGELNLVGCELSKAISVSWKLKAMAIEEFIPYIQLKLSELMGKALSRAVYVGKGKPGTGEEFKPEPEGIKTALTKEIGSPQIKKYTELAYTDLTGAMGAIHSKYANGAVIYANNNTIWSHLANLVDKMGRPMFVADVLSGGVGRIFGRTIKADAGMPEGEMLVANMGAGYVANINQDISIHVEDHAKKRKTEYVSYAIVDGGVIDNKAFVILTKETVPTI